MDYRAREGQEEDKRFFRVRDFSSAKGARPGRMILYLFPRLRSCHIGIFVIA